MHERVPRRRKWIVETGERSAILRVRKRKLEADGQSRNQGQNKQHKRENERALLRGFHEWPRLKKETETLLERLHLLGGAPVRAASSVSVLHIYRLHGQGVLRQLRETRNFDVCVVSNHWA